MATTYSVAKAKWLPAHALVLHAEIYPSVRDPLPDEIKDRGQVRAMSEWARDLDSDKARILSTDRSRNRIEGGFGNPANGRLDTWLLATDNQSIEGCSTVTEVGETRQWAEAEAEAC
jgi:hypothetical protein